MFLEVLEGVDDAEAFSDGATEWHVIDDLVLDDTVFVDEEESTVGDHFAFDGEVAFVIIDVFASEDVVIVGDGFVGVGNDRVGDTLDAAFVFGSLKPCPVGEFGVCRAADDLHVAAFKFFDFFLKAMEFGWADEGEVFGVEKENDVFFTDKGIEREVLDDVFSLDGFSGEMWGGFTYEYRHVEFRI